MVIACIIMYLDYREHFSDKMYTNNDNRSLRWNAEPNLFYNINIAQKIA